MAARTKKDAAKRRILTAVTGTVGACFLITLAVVLVVRFRWLYQEDIRLLGLPEATGLSAETIRKNYDVLIDYNLITKGVGVLQFPDFPMSEGGRIHFMEVRNIFFGFQYANIVFGVLFAALAAVAVRKRAFRFLRVTSIVTVVLPVAAGALVASSWERFFIGFHRLVFSNDYWLFDPVTDPVIDILPDAFFLHCAAAILVLVLLGSALCEALYRMLAKRDASAII